MLYPKNTEKSLDRALFQNPTSEYRGTPFWAWNDKLDLGELDEQIRNFKKMGLGGFHMHVRTGMDTPYLGGEFIQAIRHCVATAKQENMLAWLYDEDRWPSGSAGGRVTGGQPENARKTLLLTTKPYEESRPHQNHKPEPGRGQESMRQDNGELLAVYDIVLDGQGCLCSARRIGENEEAVGRKWYAYMEHATADPWFNNAAYVDTLRPEAIRKFIEITHETYAREAGADFGGAIPAIFTDEPQFAPKEPLRFAREERDVILPWTAELPRFYRDAYGEDLLEGLPELLWELPDGRLSKVRWQYQNAVTDLFVESYCNQLGDWCRAHNLLLTGHVMQEPTLSSQTEAVGDAMRCYPAFGLPGIDMLCDNHEYTTAKQAQSMARQQGAPGVLSELYGVTGWDYDFRGYKLQGDWQAALGVTVRVPHLAWMSMRGEAKRDYPASISYQSPWWDQFSLVEDHFARLNTALTRGKPVAKVAVLHPIESYWLCFGPTEQTGAACAQMDAEFTQLAETLLFGGIDFDYLCEATLPRQCPAASYPLQVGQMTYETVIVPPLRTMRSSTLERLWDFAKAGGRLIFLGDCPDYIDAQPSRDAESLYNAGLRLGFSPAALLDALQEERFLDIRLAAEGTRTTSLLHQLREDDGGYWLFIANGKNPESPDVDPSPKLRFTMKGHFAVEEYDTLTGAVRPLAASYEDGNTVLERVWHMHDSLLLRLTPGTGVAAKETEAARALGHPDFTLDPVPVTLSEPNMLLLDMAEYAVDDGPYYSEEEILRIDNAARDMLGLPLRRKEVVQPYLLKKETPQHELHLRFTLQSELMLEGLQLALEEASTAQVTLNGQKIDTSPTGWYVDKSIQKVALPALPAGKSILEVCLPFGARGGAEYLYLLGDFGVRVQGSRKVLTAPVRELGWGSIVPQGLPFYTGNVTYQMRVRTEGSFTLRVPHYRGGLVKVLLDGQDAGAIAFSPYSLQVAAAPGEHLLELRLYGTRQNGFGQLHHTQTVYFYQSPNSWRSAGDEWSYEYQLGAAGILKAPEIYGAQVIQPDGTVRHSAGTHRHIVDQS